MSVDAVAPVLFLPTLDDVERLIDLLTRRDKETLIERVTQKLQRDAAPRKAGLRGLWKGKFADEFDLGAAIKRIRDEWKGEMEELA
ncbi:MAG TPA: hypothetical protein VKX17_04915 [Planctomycetota bacterium]|nr:hypothetical protein [Planctomycetota bacterium]